MHRSRIASASLACIVLFACDDGGDDTTDARPPSSHDGGGGSGGGNDRDSGGHRGGGGGGDGGSGSGGTHGGSGGHAIDGGTDGGRELPWLEPGFRVYLDGVSIMLETRTDAQLSYLTCQNAIRVEKHLENAWAAMQDDRHPSSSNPGYYLDGEYVPSSSNLGCDQVECVPFSRTQVAGRAEEYVKTGSKAPPAGEPAAADEVDVVETRAFHGEVRVRVDYSQTPQCEATDKVVLPLTIPGEGGVCCPIGSEGCWDPGPGGGWAPSLAECKPWKPAFDVAFSEERDAHGCPTLVEDESFCCSCRPDDAGR
jgi:hypothetical protein